MIEEVSKLSIVKIAQDLYGERLKKQKNGPKYKMLCPFHEETHSSFFIRPERNYYQCYGCGVIGGPISLVVKTFRNYLESLIYLESLGLDLNKDETTLEFLLKAEDERFF